MPASSTDVVGISETAESIYSLIDQLRQQALSMRQTAHASRSEVVDSHKAILKAQDRLARHPLMGA